MTERPTAQWRDYLKKLSPSLSPEELAKERILVTGGSGFIGTNIVEFYRGWNATVCNIDIREPRDEAHRALWRNVDICDPAAVRDAIASFQPTAIFHMAARASIKGESVEDYPENLEGVRNVIEALRALPHRPRLVVASTRMVCDIHYQPTNDTDYAPPNPYGASKVETEVITRREAGNAIPWVIVRPTGVWGPWFDVPYRDFFEAVRRGLYMHPAGFNTRKAYGFVGNMVFQLDRMIYGNFSGATGRTLYSADPPVEVLGWAELIADHLGVRRPRKVPYFVFYLGAKAGDLLKKLGMKNPPLTSFRLDNLTTDMVFDRMMAEEVTGPAPFALADATAITCAWMAEGYARRPHAVE